MVQALQSVKQARDPKTLMQMAPAVLQFLDTLGPATAQHIQALASDPSRQKDYKIMLDQLKQVEMQKRQIEGQLKQLQATMQQQAKRNGQRQKKVMDEAQLDEFEAQNKVRMAQQKTDAMIAMKREKQNQSLQLADASTASKISLSAQQTDANLALKRKSASDASEE
jgi:hypothetical protein